MAEYGQEAALQGEVTDAEKAAKLRAEGQKWLERIQAAKKREHDWMKDAEAAEKTYACDYKAVEGKIYDFNILHSNVETIVPAIYNSTPVPDVRSRNTLPEQAEQNTLDPNVKAVKDFAAMIERAITVQIDDNRLDQEVESCAQDAFLSGRGVVRVKFFADSEEQPVTDPMTGQPVVGEDGEQRTQTVITNERVAYEAVSWRDFVRGPAKRFEDLPWLGFRHSMAREEFERLSDKDMMAAQSALDSKSESAIQDDDDDIAVWEIWCKEPERYVKFVRESDGTIVKIEDDPLGLEHFFPIPAMVQPITLTGKMTPVCPFTVYKRLADELDVATKRINKIMTGLKVRGLVAGDPGNIETLAQLGDNELGTAKDLDAIAQNGGLDKAVLWWPLETAIQALQQLYMQRDQTKQAIYEITGISDIVRGASQAQETATAQNIKTQWGSLRIKKMQRLIERLVRDLFSISAEIITSKFSPQTLQQMTGIQITPQIQQLMNQKVMANYRVDVESDSTVRGDVARSRQEMNEFMQGTAGYFQVMAPLAQQSPEMAEPIVEIYSAFSRAFNIGKQAEDALDKAIAISKQAAKQPRPNPEQEKLKAEMQMKQAEMQMGMEKMKAEMGMKQQDAQLKAQSEAVKLQTDSKRAEIDLQKSMVELEIKRLELEMKGRELSMNLQAKQAETGMKLQSAQQSNQMKLDAQRQSNEMKAQQAKQQQKKQAA